jgi:magnesium transporter
MDSEINNNDTVREEEVIASLPPTQEKKMSVRAYLYDATGTDREVMLDAQILADLHDRQLLWIDVSNFEESELRQVATILNLKAESVFTFLQAEHRPRLDNYGDYFQFNLNSIELTENKLKLVELDFVVRPNLVLTVHRQPVEFLNSFAQRVKGDSDLGQLDAQVFVAALLDWHVTSYFRLIEHIEAEVDKMDAYALRPRHSRDLLSELAKLRRRVAFVRRVLTPHREIYAAMARPDFQLAINSGSSTHLSLLNDRLERAIDGVENTRELLVGSFDMFTTQTALRTNDAMKVLTLVSALLLPATLIVSIMSLLIKSPVYPVGKPGFWIMLILIVLIGLTTFAVARKRRWI